MNHVERFRAVMDFQRVDRLPCIEWAHWWNRTIDRWHAEGLPAELTDVFDIHAYFGLDPYRQIWISPWAGALPEVAHGQPRIRNMDEYLALRPRMFPRPIGMPERLPQWAAQQERGGLVVWITLEGFFWSPRVLLGIENHLYAFFDQPELMHRINMDLVEWQIDVLRQMAPICRPTFMTFAEDMSYNHGPMLSKALFDEFIAPCYRRVVPVLDELGVYPVVDSDGDVSELAGWLMSVGIRGILPLERQAGCDAGAMRERYPRLGMIGHFDKMTMPHGQAAMRAEFERLLPTMRGGGLIPSVDHQTPPGVSLEQYRQYVALLKDYARRAGG